MEQSTAEREERKSQIVSAARRLAAQDRHPVLIFGVANSGKTTLLASLFNLMRDHARFDIRLGEAILDPRLKQEYDYVNEYSQKFFEWGLDDFAIEGVLLPRNHDEWPFFLSIDVSFTQGTSQMRKVLKFAFLEGPGENYAPNTERDGPRFKVLLPQVSDIIKQYHDPISVIYLAPFSIGRDSRTIDTNESDTGLRGVMTRFHDQRSEADRNNDYHLLLLNKWDMIPDRRTGDLGDAHPDADVVMNHFSARYNSAWTKFWSGMDGHAAFYALLGGLDERRG